MSQLNNVEFVEKVKEIALDYKTLYVYGCFGAPMNTSNRKRYSNNNSYNRKPARTKKIQAATSDTFGFDCSNLVKGVLWGWTGNMNKSYGGAKYCSNGVPDIGADAMIKKCKNVSTDFSKIEVGELLWKKGHVGVYVGDGLAVETTPKWKDGVQFTACNRDIEGYNRRDWTKHGKLPYIDYIAVELRDPYTLKEFVTDIQKVCGAKVDGIAGPETLSKTVTLSAKKNRKHAAVKFVQKRLIELGYEEVGKADGVAGSKFTAAVKHFQKDNDCVADGEITAKKKTWEKLLGLK